MRIRLDLNNSEFQRCWFALERDEQVAILNSLSKLAALTWDQLYRDRGFRWELIQRRRASNGDRLYSIRVTRKMRAVVRRTGEFIEFLTIHPDHDSAYQ